jgi:hypothetical protein
MPKKQESAMDDAAVRRLDALIRMNIEMNKLSNNEFSDTLAANILKSVGLTPTEIARIFGKNSRTDISGLLYRKPKKASKKK